MKLFRFIFRDRSLWYKFTLLSVAPVIFVILVIAFTIVSSLEKSLILKLSDRVMELTRLSALSVSNASVIYHKNMLDNFVDSLAKEKDIHFAAIVDESDGRILAHSDHDQDSRIFDNGLYSPLLNQTRLPSRFATSAEPGTVNLSSAPIIIEGRKYGEVKVGFSLSSVYQEIDVIQKKIVSIACISMVLGALLAVTIAKLFSRPIRAMVGQAKNIGQGHFEERVIYTSKDALGQLADSFNHMASDIKEREDRLEAEICERQRAEEFWRRYDFIVNASKDWNTLINRDYTYEAVNDAYCHSMNRNRDEIVGNSVADVWGEKVFVEIIKKKLDVCFSGEVVNYQAWFDLPLMDAQCFNITYYPYRNGENRVTHAVVVSHNITELKLTEQELRQRVQEMTSLNTLGRQVSASLSLDSVVNAALTGINPPTAPAVSMLFLLEKDQFILKGLQANKPELSQFMSQIRRLGESLCSRVCNENESLYFESFLTVHDTTSKAFREVGLRSFAALPLYSADKIIGVLELGCDTERDFGEQATFLETLAGEVAIALVNALLYEQVQRHASELERRVAERTAELETAAGKAQEADRLKSAFLAAMSHELRTPLNSIIGFTGILLQNLVGPLNDEQTKQLGMVRDSAQHLLSLINDVLDISKIEAGQIEIALETFDVRESISRVIKTATPMANKKGLDLTVRIAPDIGRVVSDRRRLEQILINLVTNAVKFTEKGKICVECGILDWRLECRVIDSGIGIKAEDMDKLFKAFQQVDTGLTRRYEGTGLGLSICKKLIEMLGGTIWVESQWGVGSTFTFALPLSRE